MTRAIVLILCLAAAGTIAGYTHYSAQPAAERTAVFVVPQKIEAPAKPSVPQPVILEVPADKASLTRALQRELKRVGCYSGDISGVWTTSSRMAMKSFVDRANAALPIDNPDAVLLSLVRNHEGPACAIECPTGQTGPCRPPVAAATAHEPTVSAPKDGPPEKSAAIVVPAAAAAGLAVAASAPKTVDERRPGADARTPATASPDTAAPEKAGRPASNSKPLAKLRDRKARREKMAQPPKFVRDLLKTVERTFRTR